MKPGMCAENGHTYRTVDDNRFQLGGGLKLEGLVLLFEILLLVITFIRIV